MDDMTTAEAQSILLVIESNSTQALTVKGAALFTTDRPVGLC